MLMHFRDSCSEESAEDPRVRQSVTFLTGAANTLGLSANSRKNKGIQDALIL